MAEQDDIDEGTELPGTAPDINGVIVVRGEDAEGNLGVDVQVIGDVRATEIATLLELGLRAWNDRLGLK